jgi:hypothetical protein
MDIYAIERFCERWIIKADAYRSDSIEDLFDRFFTLFVAYNRFYSAAAELHRATLDPLHAKMPQGDRHEATTVMARLIRQSRFTDVVNETPSIAAACQAIAELLENHHFFLHTFRGTNDPNLEKDSKLADGLRKHSLLAVLECLYQIRCNIFHGEKEFAPRQAELLAPALTLLETIVSMSSRALHDAHHKRQEALQQALS